MHRRRYPARVTRTTRKPDVDTVSLNVTPAWGEDCNHVLSSKGIHEHSDARRNYGRHRVRNG
jgi:hypothetical protein